MDRRIFSIFGIALMIVGVNKVLSQSGDIKTEQSVLRAQRITEKKSVIEKKQEPTVPLGHRSIRNNDWERGGIFGKYSPEDELLEKRSRTSKHFRNKDGTFTVIIGGPFHYKDENGVWQDMNTNKYKIGEIVDSVTIGETGVYCGTWPLNIYYNYHRNQAIYLSSELGFSGYVTSVAYYYQWYEGVDDADSLDNTIIWMKDVSYDVFDAVSWYEQGTGVYSDDLIISSGFGWKSIPINSFPHNNADYNLQISIRHQDETCESNFHYYAYDSTDPEVYRFHMGSSNTDNLPPISSDNREKRPTIKITYSTDFLVVDDTSTAYFSKYGPSIYWHEEDTVGYDGHMLWTRNVCDSSDITNWAFWHPNFPDSGDYEVFVFVPHNFATTTNAHYVIRDGHGDIDWSFVNQSIYSDKWVSIGKFYFVKGEGSKFKDWDDKFKYSNSLEIQDCTGETDDTKYIGVDAAKFVCIPSPVGIDETTDSQLSYEVAKSTLNSQLLKVYPNPFTKSTTLKYALTEKCKVCLKIYDVTGKLVKTLLDKEVEPGYHTVSWNVIDLPAGIYFCKMHTNTGTTETRKITLLR